MSDDNNQTNNPVPRVVKGTGFYTPMDLAPGEAPGEIAIPTPPQAAEPQQPTSYGSVDGTSN
jgi:hypothetical protein